jgi:site-specific DNA-methyltransferase (adenine-specific)
MDFMKGVPDKAYSLAIVDPPYGINVNFNMGLHKGQKKRHKSKKWDNNLPPPIYFTELQRISNNQIIWGGNYFELPANKHFIFWNKLHPEGMSFSDGEYAWTSFNKANRMVTIRSSWDGKIHPTEKPVQLYKWLLKNYAKAGDKILDTHLGSMSSVIACIDGGFDMTGIELDEGYFKASVQRVNNHVAQLDMYQERPEIIIREL